jgi:hypothetical protein
VQSASAKKGPASVSTSQPQEQGATEKKKKKKNSQCTYVLYLARIELFYKYDDVIFLSRF